MTDFHVISYAERAWRNHAGTYRAAVVRDSDGVVLYETWPYASEHAAIERARRWMAEEDRPDETMDLFENSRPDGAQDA